jgi:hypothetical protein
VVTLLGRLSLARAACPSYTPDPSLLENLDQVTQTMPGATPLSPEQKERFKALLRDGSPEGLAEMAQLDGVWRFFRPAPLPNPSSGPAPLTIEIVWPRYPVPNPARIEFDVNGDGKPEWVEDTYEVGTPRQYIYHKPGRYELTVRVYEPSGQMHVYTRQITVFAPADFEAELQGRWSDLKGALRRGDIFPALECVHTHSRERYRKAFEAVRDKLARMVDEILTDITPVTLRRAEAIYETLRVDKGETQPSEVRFGIDVDGVWRLTSF